MIFVELSEKRLINLDRMNWIDIQAPCPNTGSNAAACLHFGGRGDEALELTAGELAQFDKLTVYGGYTAKFGDRYIVNLQNISNIQITKGSKPRISLYFGFQGGGGPANAPLLLEDGAARDFLKSYRNYLNLP